MKDALRVANIVIGILAAVLTVYAFANGRYLTGLEWFGILALVVLVLVYAERHDRRKERERKAADDAAWARVDEKRRAATEERDREGNEIVRRRIQRAKDVARYYENLEREEAQ